MSTKDFSNVKGCTCSDKREYVTPCFEKPKCVWRYITSTVHLILVTFYNCVLVLFSKESIAFSSANWGQKWTVSVVEPFIFDIKKENNFSLPWIHQNKSLWALN